MNRLYKKCKQKNYSPRHVAEVGVYLPSTSNVVDFARQGIRTTLVEAHPTYVAEIRTYFQDYPNVSLHPVAVADTPGQLSIVTRGASTYAKHIVHSPPVVNDAYQLDQDDVITVPAERFDRIDDGSIDLLSVDIEGSEWYVIKYLKSRPVVLSVETHGKLYTNPFFSEISAWMRDNGYRVWYKDNSDTVYLNVSLSSPTLAERVILHFKNFQLRFRTRKSRLKQLIRRRFAAWFQRQKGKSPAIMKPKNKIIRYYNLIKNFSNWNAYLLFKAKSSPDKFTFSLRDAVWNDATQGDTFRITVPRSMLAAFKESFFDNIYFRNLPPYTINRSNPVVVDIGANVGYFSLYAFTRFPRARVYAFEPMPFNYQKLQEYQESYPQLDFHTINQAVSDTTEPLLLHTSKTDAYTTMASVFGTSHKQKTLSVTATTLNNIIEDYELPHIDFLKLDCEGSEYTILYGLPPEKLSKIRAMCVETHQGSKPDENTLALSRYLQNQQFTLNYLDQGNSGYIWAWQEH